MMASPVRRRTRARELALQFLYAYEMRGEEALTELDAFVDHHTKTGEHAGEEIPAKDRSEIADYARALIHGVHDHQQELNRWIEYIARNWRLDRMAYLDRNILRVALYELLHQSEIPFKVVINEAIDIAKRYSTAQSGSFVNGILDRARILIQAEREQHGVAVPQPPEAGSEGRGARPTSETVRPSFADEPAAPSPRPGGARSSEAPGPASEAPDGPAADDAGEAAMPAAGEFPAHGAGEFPAPEELSEPAPLPRPRRRRARRRRPDERPRARPTEDSSEDDGPAPQDAPDAPEQD